MKLLEDKKITGGHAKAILLVKNEAKREVWTKLIKERKHGYMAMLRNLRNILNVDIDAHTLNIVKRNIQSKDAVLSSKQLPYRFLSAFREIKNVEHPKTRFLVDALEEAVLYHREKNMCTCNIIYSNKIKKA